MQLHTQFESLIRQESYHPQEQIEGVSKVELPSFCDESGSFNEILRIDEKGMSLVFPYFEVKQSSYSLLLPEGIKAFHLHKAQDDVWFVPPTSSLLVCLVDLRISEHNNIPKVNRFTMGAGKASLLKIPKGVAHGCANLSPEPSHLIYFTNNYFNVKNPDEYRLAWNTFGEDIWRRKKD